MTLYNLYLSIFLGSVVLNILARCVNLYLSKTKHLNKEVYSYEYIKNGISEILQSMSVIPPIEMTYGSFYAYNRTKQTIILKKKSDYSVMDAFVCFHESGHCLDSFNKRIGKLYKGIEAITIINLVLLIPVLIIYSFIFIFNWHGVTSKWYVLYLMSISMLLIKMISIPLIEGRVNNIAKKYMMIKEIIVAKSKASSMITLACILSIIEQISFHLMLFSIVLLFFILCVFGIQTLKV